jgi:hypothetical protein
MAKKKSTTRGGPTAGQYAGADLQHDEQLDMAASYIEKAMGQVRICIAALESPDEDSQRYTRKALIRMLDEDVHNDLDVAREIFATWKAQEVAHGG